MVFTGVALIRLPKIILLLIKKKKQSGFPKKMYFSLLLIVINSYGNHFKYYCLKKRSGNPIGFVKNVIA